MKIMTVLGTRPEIIRLSLIIKKLDKYCEHILVHTGQNYDDNLNKIFFDDLQLRQPNFYLGIQGNTFGEQIGKILIESEKIIRKIKPDKILILGDTNSGLISIIANRMGIPVFHMEAGNRCYDKRMPEELNRIVIDNSSKILLTYTERSKQNLIHEGFHPKYLYVTGNPIFEVLEHYKDKIEASDALKKYGLSKEKYFLVTLHREENVDNESRLKNLINALDAIQQRHRIPVICSLHPRTKDKMKRFGINQNNDNVKFFDPMGFFDFVKLEKNALCVITDSGTVQEECCIFKVKNITIRDTTERPETIDCGSNILTGDNIDCIINSVEAVLDMDTNWELPKEYFYKHVSSKTVKILLGYLWEGLKAAAI